MKHTPIPAAVPASLADVAETLGVGVVLRLIQSFGGQELELPVHPRPNHPVIRALGDDGYALCHFLSGTRIYVPHTRRRRSMRIDILDLQSKGRARREIAQILGISQRHVRRMANRDDGPPPAQMSLFPDTPRT